MWKICQASYAVPSGIDGGRLALHFGAFAPWDEMNVATKVTLRNVRKGIQLQSSTFPVQPSRGMELESRQMGHS